jgi:hypothetical protein
VVDILEQFLAGQLMAGAISLWRCADRESRAATIVESRIASSSVSYNNSSSPSSTLRPLR